MVLAVQDFINTESVDRQIKDIEIERIVLKIYFLFSRVRRKNAFIPALSIL